MKKIIIKSSRRYLGFGAKHFWYVIVGDNGEILATSEMFTQKHNAVEAAQKYFPNFQQFDETLKQN